LEPSLIGKYSIIYWDSGNFNGLSKEEHPDSFINSKYVPKTQLKMEHFVIKDKSNRFYQLLRPE